MMVSHAVFCTRIASSRSTGTSNSSSAAHFIATAALRCSIRHSHTCATATGANKHCICVPLRSAPPQPAAACACLAACSLKSISSSPRRHRPKLVPDSHIVMHTVPCFVSGIVNSHHSYGIVGFIQQPPQTVFALCDLRLICSQNETRYCNSAGTNRTSQCNYLSSQQLSLRWQLQLLSQQRLIPASSLASAGCAGGEPLCALLSNCP
jgi:hypothetical protein